MITQAVDLGCEKSLAGNINLLKKEIKIEKERKPVRKIYAFPVVKSIFRKYILPSVIKDRKKLEKAIETNLKIDLPVPFENCEYDFVYRETSGKTEIFCVVVLKEDIKNIKDPIDSEIFALLRLCKINKIDTGTVVHYGKNYVYRLTFENNFPQEVRVISKEEVKKDNTLFSGCIPDFIPAEKVLKNPTGNPELNVAYGLLLKYLDNLGIDFSHKNKDEISSHLIRGIIYLILIFLIIDLSIFLSKTLKEKQLKKVLSAERELFMKYFGISQVYDPLEQAKGLLSTVKNPQREEDAAEILNYIGKAKTLSNIQNIYKINISGSTFSIQGKANSIQDVEKFKKILSGKYRVSIDETVNTPEGYIRFTIKGEL